VGTGRGLHKGLLVSAFVVFTMTACGPGGPATKLGTPATSDERGSTTEAPLITTTTTVPTSTTQQTTVGPQPGKVGDTVRLTAYPVVGPGTPVFNVTLDEVIDPAPIQVPGHDPPPHTRYVEMKVTIANVGSVTLPVQYGYLPSMLGFTWYFNPSPSVPENAALFTQAFPSATCQGLAEDYSQADVAPGQMITGCVQFGPLADSIAVTGFEAGLAYGGYNDLDPAIWAVT
jgi:hypothetical protein